MDAAPSPKGEVFPYAAGWFSQTVAGERVVWHTSWWPDAYSGLLVKVPSRKLALVLLANNDRLVSPQRGASNVLLYPIADADRLRLFAESHDPAVRALAVEAGQRLSGAFPETLGIQFDVALLEGRVRPSLRINGADAPRAVAALEKIVASTQPKPKWLDAWSHYLVAEHIAATEPQRAKTVAARALATGVDTDGLRGRIAALLAKLP